MKFNLKPRILYLCPNVAGFLKNVFKRQIRAHVKKKRWRKSILTWLGRKSVQNMARTRKWGGSHSTPPSRDCHIVLYAESKNNNTWTVQKLQTYSVLCNKLYINKILVFGGASHPVIFTAKLCYKIVYIFSNVFSIYIFRFFLENF